MGGFPAPLTLLTIPSWITQLMTPQERIQKALELSPADGYVKGSPSRKQLEDAFNAVPTAAARDIGKALEKGEGPLGALFQLRLATPTREAMIDILKGKAAAHAAEVAIATMETLAATPAMLQLTAQNFSPGPGLTLNGNAALQTEYLDMVRREMARSPSFNKLMLELNRDTAHPVEVRLTRDGVGTFMDSFDSEYTPGQQEVDMADLEFFPADPPPDHPSAITSGEILAHAMAEARQGALKEERGPAHQTGIDAQNRYRDDRGQSGHRRHRLDDGREADGGLNDAGNWEVRYDNGYNEVWVLDSRRDGDGGLHISVTKVVRNEPTP
jgi:hypothetical protein